MGELSQLRQLRPEWELGMLDVMHIFGCAGRPQFDKSGEGIIITAHDKLAHYLRLLTNQLPIESQFISSLKDNLNAEIALGTVTNVREASCRSFIVYEKKGTYYRCRSFTRQGKNDKV